MRGSLSLQMPKECRRRASKDLKASGSASAEGSRLPASAAERSSLARDAARISGSCASEPPAVMDGRPVPQVTITPEGGGSSREMQQEDMEEVVDGPLRRKLSNSSISSTGSSVVESEDDLLSDNESKSKGIVTLEHLVDAGEVSAWERHIRSDPTTMHGQMSIHYIGLQICWTCLLLQTSFGSCS